MRTTRFASGVLVVAAFALMLATSVSGRSNAAKVISISATPTGSVLDVHKLTVVVVKPKLGFRVSVRNVTGTNLGHLKVTFILGRSGGATYGAPIVKTKAIDLLTASQVKTVVFSLKAPDQVAFAQRTNVRIIVGTRSGRLVRAATYPIIFALG